MTQKVHHQTERGARIAIAKKQISRASYEAILRGDLSLVEARELGRGGRPDAPTSCGGLGAATESPRKGRTPRECLCSCGGMTKGGRFLPGHDARLHGELKRNLQKEPLMRNERFSDEQREYARQRGLI